MVAKVKSFTDIELGSGVGLDRDLFEVLVLTIHLSYSKIVRVVEKTPNS